MENYKSILKSLENSVPPEAYGYTVSMYSIALEGWRRGLVLKFINKNRSKAQTVYTLSDGKNEHTFSVTRGDAVPREAIQICVNKDLTKEYLAKADVPVPEGNNFNENIKDEEMINYANKLGYPLVLKPSDGTGGNGVIANIKNENEFKEALSYVKYDLNYKKLIIEKYFAGEDLRLYVIDNQVIAAFKKIPANVIGDGVHTIRKLIALKNEERTKTPALHNRPITIDKESDNLLKSSGYTLDSIPEKGNRIYLKTKNNVSSGGDPIDVTDELTEEMKTIAINASNAIPGLVQCGVDMMADLEKGTGVILEVNSRPHITAHLYPMIGQARDIPKAIVDYYFPETKQNIESPTYYFDYKTVFEAFSNGVCKEYIIPNVPQGSVCSARFRIAGGWGSEVYKKWVRKHALNAKLHGYVKHLQNGETSVVVSGPIGSIKKFRDTISNDSPRNVKVTNVVETSWKKPVKIGFELKENSIKSKEDNKKAKKQATSKQVKRLQGKTDDNYRSLKVERDYYKSKYLNMKDSRAWRATEPIRIIGKIIRNNTKR